MAGVGDYRDVCFHYGIDRNKIALYERHGDGPSRTLIEYLAATHVHLTVADFVGVVRNVAERDDVAKILEEYDSQKEPLLRSGEVNKNNHFFTCNLYVL